MLPLNLITKGRITGHLALHGGHVPQNDLRVRRRLNDLRSDEHRHVRRLDDFPRCILPTASVRSAVSKSHSRNEQAARVQDLESSLRNDFFRVCNKFKIITLDHIIRNHVNHHHSSLLCSAFQFTSIKLNRQILSPPAPPNVYNCRVNTEYTYNCKQPVRL